MGSRPCDGDYARFLEAASDLADAAVTLPRRPRFGMAVALLRACESDRAARVALLEPTPGRLRQAVAELRRSRTQLAEASHDAAVDGARRRSISLVV